MPLTDLTPADVPELKKELTRLQDAQTVLKQIIKEHEERIQTFRKYLLKACDHHDIDRDRHYYSGMHSAEYTNRCNVCNQKLTDEMYWRIQQAQTKRKKTQHHPDDPDLA